MRRRDAIGASREAGFTLAELAMTVLVLGILLTMGVATFTQRLQNTSYQVTRESLELIRETLISYLARNRRLPCPDSDLTAPDGDENRTTDGDVTTDCSAALGLVPYNTLGLPRIRAMDGWEHFISYDVGDVNDWTITDNFSVTNGASLTVAERDSTGTLNEPDDGANAVVILLSHGPNGRNAYTIKGTQIEAPGTGTDETDNTDGGTHYVQRAYDDDDSTTEGAFDDILVYLSVDDLTGPLIQDGSASTAWAQLDEIINGIKDAMFYYIASDMVDPDTSTDPIRCYRHRVPDADSATDGSEDNGSLSGNVPWKTIGMGSADEVLDPWSNTVQYIVSVNTVTDDSPAVGENYTGIYNGMTPGTIIYRLVSGGSDGSVDATSLVVTNDCHTDDHCYDITVGQLISKMADASINVDSPPTQCVD
ncbi:MAG: type II secretion system protein [Magnetococcales bacterium]|nr:type II secretion system protein [Magnetococcales bacterium]